jgi:hypothetical protein
LTFRLCHLCAIQRRPAPSTDLRRLHRSHPPVVYAHAHDPRLFHIRACGRSPCVPATSRRCTSSGGARLARGARATTLHSGSASSRNRTQLRLTSDVRRDHSGLISRPNRSREFFFRNGFRLVFTATGSMTMPSRCRHECAEPAGRDPRRNIGSRRPRQRRCGGGVAVLVQQPPTLPSRSPRAGWAVVHDCVDGPGFGQSSAPWRPHPDAAHRWPPCFRRQRRM